jgi:superfamily II RNA helicase
MTAAAESTSSLPPLAALLPTSGAGADELLSRFVSYVTASGLSLYPAQEEALLELMEGKHVVLNTPTGSGKSLVAAALHFKGLAEGKTSFYTSPVKALVNEKFFDLCRLFGPERVGMLTGDASINRDAPIICCTAEILANMALRDGAGRADYVVMDEFHYYADRERGMAWQIPLLCLPQTTFLLMSATLGDLHVITEGLTALTKREVAVVRGRERPVPLEFDYRETPLHETISDLVTLNRAPIYLVNFTQRGAAEEAQNLMSVDVSSKSDKEALRDALADATFDTPYGKEFQRFLRHGIGIHHAGLLPRYRLLVERLAQQGLLKVVSGTDTLGVGVNVPIRSVLFTQLCKFDGEKTGVLGVRDFLQIAGHAGRKGFDERGFVVAQAPPHVVENRRLAAKQAAGKKVVMQKPPTKGYVHWDRGTFDRLVNGTPEPLASRFEVTHGMLLNCLQSRAEGGGYRRLISIIARSHGGPRDKRAERRRSAAYFRTLRHARLIDVVPGEAIRGRTVEISPELQRDFSLNQSLSLYLLEAVGVLDRASPVYALDVLTLVEAIVENPDAVLRKQLDQLKTEKMAEMKAAGVEYEERIAQLDALEWPKPNRDFIYATFNDFAERHPWVGQDNVHPKSIAREMYEGFTAFNDYVRSLGLERSEGVLLRYLSQVFKTLEQTVPAAARTDEVLDVIAHLRSLLREVDSSLLEEWEALADPTRRPAKAARAAGPPVDPAAERRATVAGIRAELHKLVGALSRRDFSAAARLCAPVAAEGEPWTAERLTEAMAPFWGEHPVLLTTPDARRPDRTRIDEIAPGKFRAQQVLVDGEGDEDWSLDCLVDLTRPRPNGGPLIELQRIGV